LFTDDFRHVEIKTEPVDSRKIPDEIAAATELVKKMKLDYSDDMFENPTMQKFWLYLEALALQTVPGEFRDTTGA
jgi:hypothetical protein